MDFIDDDGPRRPQHGSTGLRAQQHVKRLRGGDDNVRRPSRHAAAFTRRRIAGAHPGANLDLGETLLAQFGANTRQWQRQVSLYVVGKGFERGYVKYLRFLAQAALEAKAHQGINGGKKGRERLATARRRRNQHMPAGLNGRPRLRLRRGRRGEGSFEPPGDGRVERVGTAHGFGRARCLLRATRYPRNNMGARRWLATRLLT